VIRRSGALLAIAASIGPAFAQPSGAAPEAAAVSPASAAASAHLIAPFSTAADTEPPPPWRVVTLASQPRHTRYTIATVDGSRVLRIEADASYANLLHPLSQPITATPLLRWRWRAEQLPAGADLTRKDGDDVAARVCVLFDLPLERLTATDRFKVRLGRALFDPQLPAASICYVWDAGLPAGTWLPNAYTARVQMLVLRSLAGGDATGRWTDESRDLRADFRRAFPREATNGALPPLAAIGVAADGDNTRGRALSFIGDLRLDADAR
jgi:Protein of unknown function (DUF3047)